MSRSVFLSYASEDRREARSIGDALTKFGLDVWLDESELGGGDAWDQKIRRQIRECDFFMPIVSARTEARHEGYFRREWRLAVERTLDMADDHPFLLPVAIDDTDQANARVPEKFLAVHWLRVPDGRPTPALESLCRRIAHGEAADMPSPKTASARPNGTAAAGSAFKNEGFPIEVPGQRARFWFQVLAWAIRSAWAHFKRLPRWLRILVYLWIAGTLLSHGCSQRKQDTADISPATAAKLKAISDVYSGSTNKADIAKLGVQIAREFSDASTEGTARSEVLAIPFTAPPGDPAAAKLADAAFAQTYGRIAISHRGQVSLIQESLPEVDARAALDRGRANHSVYVLFGAVARQSSAQVLMITILRVADAGVIWSKSFPVSGADPIGIAAEVDRHVPAVDSP